MCIIIDANVAGELPGPSADAKPVVDWIEGGSGRLVIGGRNTVELDAHRGVRRWLIGLLQSGRARSVSAEIVQTKERELLASGRHRSDDPHMLALALASGARLLFSRDRDLHHDFGNPELIRRPRGKVYQ